MFYYVLFGLILIAAGLLLRFVPIRKNYFFGYRSFQSMKTIESWKYANVTFGKFSIVIGCVSLLFGAVCYFFGFFDYKVVVIATTAALVLCLIYIEIRLSRRAKQP